MSRPKSIVQPGPIHHERSLVVAARGRPISIDVRAGENLLAALARGFAAHGALGGVARLEGVALQPFAYVMPAPARTAETVAHYSDTFRPRGISRIETGAMTIGRREGAPFYHCHALWQEADGKRSGGHILPEATEAAEAARIEAFALDGAVFETRPDSETNFRLFEPVKAARGPGEAAVGPGAARAVAVRVRPNQDLIGALESVAAAHGFRRARIRGGVGSLIGAQFADGSTVEPFITEAFIVGGGIEPGASGKPEAEVDVALVDVTGATARGRLVRGANPVLITFEVALEELGG